MANKTKKLNYLKAGFIIPMVYSTISGVIMALVYLVTNNPQIFGTAISALILQAGTISVVLSPSALIVCGSLARKHRNRFPLETFFYSELPLVLSFLVLGFQVLYLVMLTM